MKNFIQSAAILSVTAPAVVASGDGVLVGTIFGVAQADAASGDPVEIVRGGVFDLPKVSAQAWTAGAKIYWDNGAGNCTTTASGNTLIGAAAEPAANPTATGRVVLDGAIR